MFPCGGRPQRFLGNHACVLSERGMLDGGFGFWGHCLQSPFAGSWETSLLPPSLWTIIVPPLEWFMTRSPINHGDCFLGCFLWCLHPPKPVSIPPPSLSSERCFFPQSRLSSSYNVLFSTFLSCLLPHSNPPPPHSSDPKSPLAPPFLK